MKTIDKILAALHMVAVVIAFALVIFIASVLVFGPDITVMAQEGYPVDEGYPIEYEYPTDENCIQWDWFGYCVAYAEVERTEAQGGANQMPVAIQEAPAIEAPAILDASPDAPAGGDAPSTMSDMLGQVLVMAVFLGALAIIYFRCKE